MADPTASSESTGYGQQEPGDSNSDADVWTFIGKQLIAQLEKMKLCQVKKVNGGDTLAAPGTVDVLLLVSLIDSNGGALLQGTVYGIPWFRYGGGKNAVVIDPQVGDIGFLVAEDRDISGVKKAVTEGKDPQTTPGSFRKNSISDAIYVGQALSKDAPDQYIWFMPDGGIKIADKYGNVIQIDTHGINITVAPGKFMDVAGAVRASGIVQAGHGGVDQIGLQTHTHPSNGAPPTPGT